MQIHYFQRYHEKENVATANTMLLLSRLYYYSPNKFFKVLKSEYFSESFEPEIVFNIQEKCDRSIPDATIFQDSFKIVVETKMTDWFYDEQLLKHLDSFNNETCKVLITLSSEYMNEDTRKSFESKLDDYNKNLEHKIIHINTTFEALTNAINDILDDRDYEMQNILDDYLDYCYTDKLISISDSWKYLRVQLASNSFDFNVSNNVYFDRAIHGFRAHDTLGLYKDKSVRAIGKIVAIISAVDEGNGIEYFPEKGDLTEDRKNIINKAIAFESSKGNNLKTIKHRYFFVDKFYQTDFKKITRYAPWGTRIFDLTQVIGSDNIPNIEELAKVLTTKNWS